MNGGIPWFTSDLHFGHRLVAEYRGFTAGGEPDVHAHDEAIGDAWCSVVRPDDHVWVLGDLSVSSPTHPLNILRRLPGIKHLVWGNHDAGHPMHRTAHKHQGRYLEVFDSTQQSARRRIYGREVLLSHFPYSGDHTEEERHTQWRLRDEGLPLLHGHTHSVVRESWTVNDAHQIHVGVDAWNLTPVSMETIADIMRSA